MTETPELLNCPFCASQPELNKGGMMIVHEADCFFTYCDSPVRVISEANFQLWNTRASVPVSPAEQCPTTCKEFSMCMCKQAHRCVKDAGHPFDPMYGEIHEFETHQSVVKPRAQEEPYFAVSVSPATDEKREAEKQKARGIVIDLFTRIVATHDVTLGSGEAAEAISEIAAAISDSFQRGTDAGRRECAGIAVAYMRQSVEGELAYSSFELGSADAADRLATTYRENLGLPVKGQE